MPTPREQARERTEVNERKRYLKMPSGIGEVYEHPVHGVGKIVKHRPAMLRGVPREAPFIEVLLEFKTYEFWTAACYLDTMEYIKR